LLAPSGYSTSQLRPQLGRGVRDTLPSLNSLENRMKGREPSSTPGARMVRGSLALFGLSWIFSSKIEG
jgi:hypothetical protein